MAKIVVNRNYLDMTIPELKMAQRDVKKFWNLAIEKNVPSDDPMLNDIIEDAQKISAALKIAKLESKIHNLKQNLSDKKEQYWEKYREPRAWK